MGVSGKPLRKKWSKFVLTFLCVPYTFRIRSPCKMKDFCQKLYVPIRSVQPSRNSLKLLYVPIRSPYVPDTFSTQNKRIWSKVIRSYTFRATLPLKAGNVVTNYTFLYVLCEPFRYSCGLLYVPIRSVYVLYTFPHTTWTILIKSYTFLYVLCYPPAILSNLATKSIFSQMW